MERIGVIGLGRMGSAIARRMAAAGHPVTGWTRSGGHVAGIHGVPDVEQLVARSDTVILSLFDDAAVAEMLDAVLEHDLSGKLIVETSTVVPALLTDRMATLEDRGAMAVDAPISGGPELVAAGSCGIFVGGADAAAGRARAVLAPLSQRIFHVGPLGAGLVMKTINNGLMQGYGAILTDMLQLAKRAGLSLDMTLSVVCGGPAGLPVVRDRIPKTLGQDRSVGFPMAGILKDNDVFQRVLAQFDVQSPVLSIAGERQRAAIVAGFGDSDVAATWAAAYANG